MAVALAAAATFTACASNPGTETRTAGGDVAPAAWSAPVTSTVVPVSGQVAIYADEPGSMRVVVDLQSPPSASGTLAFRLYQGSCISRGTLVGNPSDYPPVTLTATGSADGSAVISRPVPTDGVYSVRVFSGIPPGATLISCTDLIRRG